MKRHLKTAAIAGAALLAAFGFYTGLKKYKRAECFGNASPQAVAACGWLLERTPAAGRAGLFARRAQLHERAGRREDLVSDLLSLAELKEAGHATPAQALAAYEGLARVYAAAGAQAEAAKYRGLAAAAGSADGGILLPLAEAALERQDWPAARRALAAASAKKDRPYYHALAAVLEGEGRVPEAYAELKTALSLPGSREEMGETARRLGSVCYYLKKYDEARTYVTYAQESGAPCLECGLLLNALRGKGGGPGPVRKKRK